MNVNGKVAVVTGGASGIGLALCTQFAKEGANVVLSEPRTACWPRTTPTTEC
jgi:NAD(P)-dependent dehydrogenase (short-subunit alcohol dehydrogenase family)